MIEKKEFAKSVRMTATVKDYVEGFEGNGFNEKFENLVMFCLANEAQIKEQIERSQQDLFDLKAEISQKRTILKTLEQAQHIILDLFLLVQDTNLYLNVDKHEYTCQDCAVFRNGKDCFEKNAGEVYCDYEYKWVSALKPVCERYFTPIVLLRRHKDTAF